ncbi:recombinase family protein [Thermogemmatispora sp.]|uniref:recombinase family protein n=1 Tax=Thermogemmatispora sp. TaxID=1968838 RepID=UPI0035E44F2D
MKQQNSKRIMSHEDLFNPVIDIKRDACIYARQSDRDQVIENIQSHISQTIDMLEYAKNKLGFKDDGSTGKVYLFIENEVIDKDGNKRIKSASGTWPIERRPGLQTICNWIEEGRIGVVLTWSIDRLFRDEDGIDSNRFVKLCRENNCLLHVASKGFTYNFSNEHHVLLFRFEVQMASWYITHHVKYTMLARRAKVVSNGKWGGLGNVPVGYMVCEEKESEFYKKFVPYEPHARIVRRIFERFIELGYNFRKLYKELAAMPAVFPPFPPGQKPKHCSQLTPTAEGYSLSKASLARLLVNETYIGVFRRQVAGEEICIKNNHPPIVPEEIFWEVYRHLRDTWPDGTPTGRTKTAHYSRKDSPEERKPLLNLTSPDGSVRWARYEEGAGGWYYKVVKYHPLQLGEEYILSVDADIIEGAVVENLFKKLRRASILDIKRQQEEEMERWRSHQIKLQKKIDAIQMAIDSAIDGLNHMHSQKAITEVEQRIEKYIDMREEAKRELERISQEKPILGTLEEELARLEEQWSHKPFELRQTLLQLLIAQLSLHYLSPHLYAIRVEWKWPSWGTEEAIFLRPVGGRRSWTEEELSLLTKLYPTAPQLEILKALPRRTWGSITSEANKRGLVRPGRPRRSFEKWFAFKDIECLRELGLKEEDFERHIYNSRIAYHTTWSTSACLPYQAIFMFLSMGRWNG